MVKKNEEKYDIGPTEDPKINAAQAEFYTKYNKTLDAYREAKRSFDAGERSFSEEDVNDLAEKHLEVKRQFDNVTEKREDYVLDQIQGRYTIEDGKLIPLVFGNYHNFQNNLEKQNQENGAEETDFGLIKLTPREINP